MNQSELDIWLHILGAIAYSIDMLLENTWSPNMYCIHDLRLKKMLKIMELIGKKWNTPTYPTRMLFKDHWEGPYNEFNIRVIGSKMYCEECRYMVLTEEDYGYVFDYIFYGFQQPQRDDLYAKVDLLIHSGKKNIQVQDIILNVQH